MFLQTNISIHVHPPPLSAGDFSRALSGLVKSLSILLNRHTQQKTSGIQGTSPGICHNRFFYLLVNSFFRDLQRPWLCFRWLIFCRGSTIWTDWEGTARLEFWKRGTILASHTYFLLTRLAKGKEYITKPQEHLRASLGCNFGAAWQIIVTQASRPIDVHPQWWSCFSLILYLPFNNSAVCYVFR